MNKNNTDRKLERLGWKPASPADAAQSEADEPIPEAVESPKPGEQLSRKLTGKIAIGNKYKNDSLTHLIGDNKNQDILPSFLIIGVMKCGTSAINKFLRYHPDLRIGSKVSQFRIE